MGRFAVIEVRDGNPSGLQSSVPVFALTFDELYLLEETGRLPEDLEPRSLVELDPQSSTVTA